MLEQRNWTIEIRLTYDVNATSADQTLGASNPTDFARPGSVLAIFAIASTVLVAFGVSNGIHAAPGTGMSIGTLSTIFSVSLGVLTLTSGVIVSHIFSKSQV